MQQVCLAFKDFLQQKSHASGVEFTRQSQHLATITYALYPDRFGLDAVSTNGQEKLLPLKIPVSGTHKSGTHKNSEHLLGLLGV